MFAFTSTVKGGTQAFSGLPTITSSRQSHSLCEFTGHDNSRLSHGADDDVSRFSLGTDDVSRVSLGAARSCRRQSVPNAAVCWDFILIFGTG